MCYERLPGRQCSLRSPECAAARERKGEGKLTWRGSNHSLANGHRLQARFDYEADETVGVEDKRIAPCGPIVKARLDVTDAIVGLKDAYLQQ